jgi:hypothetical protein
MILKYRSGEEIKTGDRVLFHGNPAEIEFVASDFDDPGSEWYMQKFGGGVCVLDPMVSGSTFIPAAHLENYEDLEFVSRSEG